MNHPPMPAPRRLRTPEAATHLGIAASTLEKLRTYGGGPRFFKLGRAVTYCTADLDEWAAARSATNTAEARALSRAAV